MKKSELIVAFALLLVCLVSEPVKFGFELGGHLGWVASHTSSQIIHASLDSGFVGYSYKTISQAGPEYQYFDRYPLFFSAFTNLILMPFKSNLGWWIYLSKILMNVIFVLLGLTIYQIAGFFLENKWQRLSVALLSLSGEYFVTYRSMLHFDQPAILAQAFLIYAILKFEFKKDSKLFFWTCFLCPLVGRGYVSLFTLALYFFLRFIVPGGQNRWGVVKLSLKTLIPSTILCMSFLTYNIFQEAHIRKVSLSEVSIVKSAKSRLGVTKHKNTATENDLNSFAVLSTQWKRFCRHLTPYSFGKTIGVVITMLLLVLFFIFIIRLLSEPPDFSGLMLIFIFLTGPAWVFPMKRLTHFHDYTAMYFWATGVCIFIVLLKMLPPKKWISYITIGVFLLSLGTWYKKSSKSAGEVNKFAGEMKEIRKVLANYPEVNLHVEGPVHGFFPKRPYLLGFYFYDKFLTEDPRLSKLTLSRSTLPYHALYDGATLKVYQRD